MAQVAAAVGAHNFGADHPVGFVQLFHDGAVGDALVEGRPSAVRVKFRVGGEQWGVARAARVGAFFEVHVVFAGVGAFGALLTDDKVFLRGQLFFPLLFGFLERKLVRCLINHGFIALCLTGE